jgi:hypothetical protein
MWLKIDYKPASLFSFRNIKATGSGATTLLCPTPFAVKMALVDTAIKCKGLEYGKQVYEKIKSTTIKFKLPQHCVVNKTIIRIFNLDNRYHMVKNDAGKNVRATDENGNYITGNPVKPAFREFVYFSGDLSIAVDISDLDDDFITELTTLFMGINYFGKKGSFMQFVGSETLEELPPDFLQRMDSGETINTGKRNFLLTVEDTNEDITFEQINVFDSTKPLDRTKQMGHYHLLVPAEEIISGKRYKYIRVR